MIFRYCPVGHDEGHPVKDYQSEKIDTVPEDVTLQTRKKLNR